ncbi:hypothetical protein Daura_36020 [Dactylosporangium aurantiacum]|uniref:Uncharacterized protein n=1 Tax=Dactylosporangium aurantiacum TaxID=35754 RepID=A0A9Q9MAP5_9ACTN|nr:hypothetical protein [Dactylosporangium aurantiacum]MDG6103419.1 hypothetical protein [Dactylosporangium aurantiacum]UWZ52073.1 hypothetical protein Daura_36020 [Dactylosporangium aurantiacum]
MGRTGWLLVLVVLLVVAGASVGHLLGRRGDTRELTGVIGSQMTAFFADPAVRQALADHGVRLRLDPAGSRRMADLDLGGYDFAFPGSAPAAAEITRRRPAVGAPVAVFTSPLAVASFTPVVDLLQTAGLARRVTGGHWTLDLKAFVAANQRGLRWDQIPGNATFPVRQAVLVATTRPADSNSAALFAALLNQVTGGDLAAVTKAFADQGAVDTTTGEPFESWLRRGKDFAPLLLIYEAQFLERYPAPGAGADRIVLYPAPTILSEHTVVPFTTAGADLAHLLATDPQLQRLAAAHGFRTAGAPGAPGVVALGATDTIPSPDEPTLHALLAALEERLT